MSPGLPQPDARSKASRRTLAAAFADITPNLHAPFANHEDAAPQQALRDIAIRYFLRDTGE